MKWEQVGQVIERLGSILAENDAAFQWISPYKVEHDLPGLIVKMGRKLGFESSTTMYTCVPGHSLVDLIFNPLKRRRAGGIIEVDIAFQCAI